MANTKVNYDERGAQWIVMIRDPAYKLVQKLNKLGYHLVVLPRYTYKTGELTKVQSQDYVRNTRLNDCLMELGYE